MGKAADGHTRWLCQCDCGKQTIVTTQHLTSGHTTSCGHVKMDRNHTVAPGYEAKRVDGVAVFLLSDKRKKRTDNTTGYTGVKKTHYKNGSVHYVATINVAGVRHHLGTFSTIKEALEARKAGEEKYIPKGKE